METCTHLGTRDKDIRHFIFNHPLLIPLTQGLTLGFYTWFLCGCQGFELRSSCLYNKYSLKRSQLQSALFSFLFYFTLFCFLGQDKLVVTLHLLGVSPHLASALCFIRRTLQIQLNHSIAWCIDSESRICKG